MKCRCGYIVLPISTRDFNVLASCTQHHINEMLSLAQILMDIDSLATQNIGVMMIWFLLDQQNVVKEMKYLNKVSVSYVKALLFKHLSVVDKMADRYIYIIELLVLYMKIVYADVHCYWV